MDLGNGWGLNDTLRRKLRLLDYLADNSRGSLIPGLPEWAQEVGSSAHADAISDLKDFNSRGWLRNFDQTYDGSASAQLVGPGYAFVEEVRERRLDRTLRARASRDAVLHWLREVRFDTDSAPDLYDVLQTRFGRFYGEPFTRREIEQASAYLFSQHFITGVTTAQGPEVHRPQITEDGIDMVDSKLSVNDRRVIPVPNIVTTTITGDGNTVQTASPGASQTVTNVTAEIREAVRRVADELEQALPVLQGASPDMQQIPGELRRAADGDRPGAIAETVRTAEAAIVGAAASPIGTMIFQHLHAILVMLGRA